MDVIDRKEKCVYCAKEAIAVTESGAAICITHFKEIKEKRKTYINS